MSERIVVRQYSDFRIEFLAADPHHPESDELQPVGHIHALTPYGLLMASLAACTTIVLHTYAQNHDVALAEVEAHVRYERVFLEDCQNCQEIDRYQEQLQETLTFRGDLTEAERQKLFKIAHQCSIHKMLESGIEIRSELNTRK
jgi:putative redox protein